MVRLTVVPVIPLAAESIVAVARVPAAPGSGMVFQDQVEQADQLLALSW